MKANEILISIMEEKGISKAQLGRAVGIEAPTSDDDTKYRSYQTDVIGKRLRQKTMSVNLFYEMLDAMGYTIIVAPKGAKKVDKGEYEVDNNG